MVLSRYDNTQPKRARRGGCETSTAGAPELTWGPTLHRAKEFAAEFELRADRFFEATGERPGRPGSADPRIPLDVLAHFLTWAAEASGEAAFGLKLGAQFHPSDLGAYGYLLLNSRTLGEAMGFAQRFADFQQQGDAFAFVTTGGGRFEMRYDARGLEQRLRIQDTECTLAIVHSVFRHLSGTAIRPTEVRVQHVARKRGLRLEEHFLCPVIYSDRDNALCYEIASLAHPIRGADAKLLPILRGYVERELEGLPPISDEVGRVQWAIRRTLGRSRVSLERVARDCRLRERTLQRRLAARSLTFSRLVDHVRREIYAELERAGTGSQREIAEQLGFGDASAFAKAKRRWSHGRTLTDSIRT